MNSMTTEPIPSPIGYRVCPSCMGDGELTVTDCCGEEASGNGDASFMDYGLCPYCKDYCGYETVECEVCGGAGEIPIDQDYLDFLKNVDDKNEDLKL